MKTFFKFFGAAFGLAFLVCSIYVVNLFSSKPFSLDHYLAKELKSVEFFDGNLIEKYKNFVDNIIKKYGKDFKTVPDRNPESDKKQLEIGDTLVILQKPKTEKDYKISTAFKPNKK